LGCLRTLEKDVTGTDIDASDEEMADVGEGEVEVVEYSG